MRPGDFMQTIVWRTFATVCFAILCAETCAIGDDLFPDHQKEAEVTVSMGKHEVLLPSGTSGLTHFPDEPICIVEQKPLTFTMVSADSTILMRGSSFKTAKPVNKILAPGPKGSIDNNYAGISSVYHDVNNKRWICLYHAEDKEELGMIKLTAAQGMFGTIGALEIADDGKTIKKLGSAITADKPKLPRGWETEGGPPEAWLAQGVGTPSHCISADERDLVCWYTEWSNRLKRGVQICMARCPIESAGLPGSWNKFYLGGFTEPGIGGHDSTVVSVGKRGDTFDPHVQYVKTWERYVMVFGCVTQADIHATPPKAIDSGLFVTTSKDGTTWCKPTRIEQIFPLVVVTQKCKVRPTFLINKTTDKTITGQLIYGYTPQWPKTPHHMGGCSITITRKD